MIFLNPETVSLGSQSLTNVSAIAIDRESARLIDDWSDLGPHLVLADVPEQRVRFQIVRAVTETETAAPRPGDQLALSFRTAPSASALSIRRITATLVITAVRHSIDKRAGATQRIEALASSPTGAADPITETIVEGEV